ncbi:MAG: hypothetical protein WAK39_03505, partial [Pseudolabrys sp.]
YWSQPRLWGTVAPPALSMVAAITDPVLTTGVVITKMAGTTGEDMVMAEPSSDTTDSAGNN